MLAGLDVARKAYHNRIQPQCAIKTAPTTNRAVTKIQNIQDKILSI